MIYELYIEIKDLPKTINAIGRSHWTVKAKEAKLWKELVFAKCIYKKPLKPLEKATIHYERHSSHKIDFDNLAISFKHPQDGLKMAGIIKDDSPDIINCSYAWIKCKKNEGKITIKVMGEL